MTGSSSSAGKATVEVNSVLSIQPLPMDMALAVLRFPGWSLSGLKIIPDSVLSYIAKQVGVGPGVFPLYAQREPTRREHMEEIRQAFGYKNFTLAEYRSISQIMLKYETERCSARH